MEDKFLLKWSLAIVLAGILTLYWLSTTLTIEPGFEGKGDGDRIRLRGVVRGVSGNDKVTFIEVEHECVTTTILFDKIEIEEGSSVDVLGNLQYSNGKREVIIEELGFD